MKIKFIINPISKKTRTVSSWREIEKEKIFNKNLYYIVKTLELNSNFEKELIKSRNILNIPENGYELKEYLNIINFEKDSQIGDQIGYLGTAPIESREETKRLEKIFIIDPAIKFYLDCLLYGNYVYPTNGDYFHIKAISHEIVGLDTAFPPEGVDFGDDRCLSIAIKSSVSKNCLKKYIDENWLSIERSIKLLKGRDFLRITKRDLRIFELKQKNNKITYEEIANIIINEFTIDDPDGRINSGSVKTAYKRTKIKIESIAKHRQKKP